MSGRCQIRIGGLSPQGIFALACLAFVLIGAPGTSCLAQPHEMAPIEIAGYEMDLAAILCADQGKWLECYNHDPRRCMEVVRPLVHTCVSTHLADVKKPIKLKTGLEKNVKIIDCLNREFPRTIGARPKDEARCKQQPKHLK